ncbi:MAG: DUF1896 domain-containing protein [Dysgonamonadaceae bacterium]|nr:DUF1896 domain-containing protein [Dysgonamonadaceae bacterium]
MRVIVIYKIHPRNVYSETAPAATDAYEQAIKNGDTPVEAAEQANAVLFSGLHFSKYDTLKNILRNEFADEVPAENVLMFKYPFLMCQASKRFFSVTVLPWKCKRG